MKGQIGAVSSQFIRKLVAATENLEDPVGMLASVGLPAKADAATAT